MSEFSGASSDFDTRLKALEASILGRISAEWQGGSTVHIRSDFDGTLTEFTDYPAESLPLPQGLGALMRFAQIPRVSAGIVTGRSLAFASQVFPDPKIELDCSYGAESRHDGVEWQAPWIMEGQPKLNALRASLIAEIRALGADASTNAHEAAERGYVYVESQPTKISFHVRGGSKTNPQLPAQLASAATRLNDDFGLGTRSSASNIEYDLRAPSGDEVNKAAVFARLLGLGGDHTNFVIYTGDDTGDVDAGRLVHQHGGIVMAVQHDETPKELLDIADFVFESPQDHVTFLDRLSSDLKTNP